MVMGVVFLIYPSAASCCSFFCLRAQQQWMAINAACVFKQRILGGTSAPSRQTTRENTCCDATPWSFEARPAALFNGHRQHSFWSQIFGIAFSNKLVFACDGVDQRCIIGLH